MDINLFVLARHVRFYRTWELTAAWTRAEIKVPVKFIVGDLDLTYHFPGAQQYIHGDGFKRDVPGLEEVVVMEDTSHFINQERPNEINAHIHDFFNKFCWSSLCFLVLIRFVRFVLCFCIFDRFSSSQLFIFMFVSKFKDFNKWDGLNLSHSTVPG